jgi:hypothetical protein
MQSKKQGRYGTKQLYKTKTRTVQNKNNNSTKQENNSTKQRQQHYKTKTTTVLSKKTTVRNKGFVLLFSCLVLLLFLFCSVVVFVSYCFFLA